jgi:DNA replication protein DnaC
MDRERVEAIRGFVRARFLESLPSGYETLDWTRIPNAKLTRHVLDYWQMWDEETGQHAKDSWGHDKPGLLFYGESGSGKTRTAYALLKNRLDDGELVSVVRAVQWAATTSARAKDCKLEFWVDEVLRYDGLPYHLVLVDDLDKARFTPTVQAELFNLVETATSEGIPLIVTTNITSDKLAKRFEPEFGEPIMRRLNEFCTPVHFKRGITP